MPAMIVRFYQGWFQMLYIDLPLFMASTLWKGFCATGSAGRANCWRVVCLIRY